MASRFRRLLEHRFVNAATLFIETILNNGCGNPGHDGIGRHIFCDDGPCSHDRSVSNAHSSENGCGMSDENVMTDDRLGRFRTARIDNRNARLIVTVIFADEGDIGRETRIVADLDLWGNFRMGSNIDVIPHNDSWSMYRHVLPRVESFSDCHTTILGVKKHPYANRLE